MELVVVPRRRILTDTRQNLWAILLLMAIVLTYVLASAALIWRFETLQQWSYSESVYFTVINVTTVGFGDYFPKTTAGRSLACVNALIGVLFFGLLVAVVALAFQPGELTATTTFQAPSASVLPEPVAEDTSIGRALSVFLRAIGSSVEPFGENRRHRKDVVIDVNNHKSHVHIIISLRS